MSFSLTFCDKNVLITGASRGIGLAVARRFANYNPRSLVLVSRNRQTLKRAVEPIAAYISISSSKGQPRTAQLRTRLELIEGDVSIHNFWKEVGRNMKDIDILVNAAGVTHSSLLVSTSIDMLQQTVDTNLMGTMWACREMAKTMIMQKRTPENTACIINVASLLGLKGGKGSSAYAASKAGVLGLTRSLAAELGPSNIRVNAIVPGYIETQMTQGMTPEARSAALDAIPQKRFGTTAEVASAVLFLASNTYANNCVLNLDGALSAT